MKKLIAALTLTIAAQGANAALINMNSMGQDGFVNAFTLKTFQFGEGSVIFQNADEIIAGSISLNKQTNELRMVLNRHFYCPPGKMCPMIMPTPIIVTLPIVYLGVTSSGGTMIVAERNTLTTDGDMLSVQVIDSNLERRNFPTSDLMPVQITVTEQAAHSALQIVSHMTGTATDTTPAPTN